MFRLNLLQRVQTPDQPFNGFNMLCNSIEWWAGCVNATHELPAEWRTSVDSHFKRHFLIFKHKFSRQLSIIQMIDREDRRLELGQSNRFLFWNLISKFCGQNIVAKSKTKRLDSS